VLCLGLYYLAKTVDEERNVESTKQGIPVEEGEYVNQGIE
jgi:hypothetical protein